MNRKERRAEKKRGKHAGHGLSPATQAVFATAVRHHQEGRPQDAEPLYRQVLAVNPHHADSLHLLGVACHQTGRDDLAVDLLRRAIAVDADVALYHANLGNILKALGQPDQAVAAYGRAIEVNPGSSAAHNNLGVALQRLGRLDQAAACLRQAIALDADFAEAHGNLGNVLLDQGRADEALACHRRTVALKPGYADAHNNLGAALKALGALDEAAASIRAAIALRPDFPEAHNNLATVLLRQGLLDEAAASCRKAIGLKPDFPEAYDNLGAAFADQGLLDAAVASCRKALGLRPDYPQAHNSLGVVLNQQGRLDEAIACFREATRRDPDFASAHHNLAMAVLAHGDMVEGWRESVGRWRTPEAAASRRPFTQPQWRGEQAAGLTLLIHAEQGLGDTIQFCRYGVLAAARGLRVVIEAQKPLVRLLRGLADVDQVIARGEDLPAFDLHCPMLSLPLALGTTLDTIPNAASYLRADPVRVAAWRARLDAIAGGALRVGVAWAGGSATVSDARRSLSPDRLAPLFALSGLQVVSLQKDGPCAPAAFPLIDVMPEIDDFADTAALIANLDLVISVDTAVAHLAAALGKPTWLLDRFDADWRWLRGRTDSPWYPSLRLYRQPKRGDWDVVVAKVAEDLRGLADAGPSHQSERQHLAVGM